MNPEAVVTIGVFDGFHRGHAAVVSRARAAADAAEVRLGVYTFDPHPKAVVAPAGAPPPITVTGEKIALLREAGADDVHVLRFDTALAALAAETFLEQYVLDRYRLRRLVVGHDFAMGRNRSGSVPRLKEIGRELGFPVDQVAALELDGVAVSSSAIRVALGRGDVAEAARLLGRPFRLSGRVIGGDGRGRTLGFPTANLAGEPGRLRPGGGVYAVTVTGAGPDSHPGVVNVGRRPTFDGDAETVEVHLLGFEGDLVGRELALDFQARLRGERKFNSGKELADQIRRDAERARKVLEPGEPPDFRP